MPLPSYIYRVSTRSIHYIFYGLPTTIQHYAKILDRKVSDDMAILKQKFADKSNIDASKRIAN